ncbi:MAG: flavin reductase family protein [Coriobacteriia bacterium]|nr:flavin reductase family protein [Coriobacteriia bacterium]
MQSSKLIGGRDIAALLHPRPVYLITTCDALGRPDVSAVAWVTPLSHTPPLVGISVRPKSRTHTLIEESGQFVINVADTSMQKAVEVCGNVSGHGADKIELAGLVTEEASCVSPPRLSGARAWIECAVEQRIDAGDHVLFMARILVARAKEGFENGWDPDRASILLCSAHDRFGHYIDRKVS